jgi:hypothetical protein
MDCRTAAQTSGAACAGADDPESCLEMVAEARGACLDLCGTELGAALEECGNAFEDCKAACHTNDPNGPEGTDE